MLRITKKEFKWDKEGIKGTGELWLPKAANELFCVTDGQDYTMSELVDSISNALGMIWRSYHVPVLLADLAGEGLVIFYANGGMFRFRLILTGLGS